MNTVSLNPFFSYWSEKTPPTAQTSEHFFLENPTWQQQGAGPRRRRKHYPGSASDNVTFALDRAIPVILSTI